MRELHGEDKSILEETPDDHRVFLNVENYSRVQQYPKREKQWYH